MERAYLLVEVAVAQERLHADDNMEAIYCAIEDRMRTEPLLRKAILKVAVDAASKYRVKPN